MDSANQQIGNKMLDLMSSAGGQATVMSQKTQNIVSQIEPQWLKHQDVRPDIK